MVLMLISVNAFCQITKTDSTTLSNKALDKMILDIEKYRNLKIRYAELLEEVSQLQDEVDVSLGKINLLESDKLSLTSELKTIKETKPLSDFKRFNISIQLGTAPLFKEDDFSIRPYFGLGVGCTIFRF